MMNLAHTAGPGELPIIHKRHTCRACADGNLHLFLSLGHMPLANAFLRSPAEFRDEPSYPLDVYFCSTCSLVQLLDVVAPEVLFREYIYVTGTSETIQSHNVQYARTVVDLLNLTNDDLVVEVASNDGSLLKCFQQHGVQTLGVEPATNIAEQARARGINTVNRFFDSSVGRDLRNTYGRAKAVIGNNVLAHVDDTQDFLLGCRELLDDNGLAVMEVPYLRDFIDNLEYDTIYHEHLCYFSVTALLRLCSQVGLTIVRLDHLPVHGGSLRVYARRGSRQQDHVQAALAMAEEERLAGLTSLPRFERFAADVKRSRESLLELLAQLTTQEKSLAGYGAPAKGNTLLNYCGINNHIIPYTVDQNPLKVGLYTPGTHIPVLPVSTLLDKQPDYTLILAWNFAEEVLRQQSEYRARGGHFIIPVPDAKVV